MRSGFKLLAKLLALVLFLLYTPFFEGMRQLVESSHFLDLLVVRQESAETSFSLKGQLNVLSVPKQ